MHSFFTRPLWEILVTFFFASACVGGLAWLFIWLFKPNRIRIGQTDIVSLNRLNLEKKNCEKEVRDIQLVVSQSVLVGFEICKLKLVDIIQIQEQYSLEKLEGWNLFVKEEFIKLLSTKDEYKENDNLTMTDEARLFFNVLRGFTEQCKKILRECFVANNFRLMSEQEFNDMIKRKATLLESVFDKYFRDNYFEEICTLSVAELTRDLKGLVKDDFQRILNEIFIYARGKKIDIEIQVDKKKKDLEEYIQQYINKDFTFDMHEEVKNH